MALREAGKVSVAYFYFDFRDTNKQSCQDLVHSLLIQLSAQSHHSFDTLSRLHSDHDHGTRLPSDDEMMECLKEMLSTANQTSTYIIIDALDECPNTPRAEITSPREHVLILLKKLVELRLPNLYICVTSRPEVDIRRVLEPLTQNHLSLHTENGQIEDVIGYINFVIHSDAMGRCKDEDKVLIMKTLSEKADGM
jgi:NACHT domain